MMKTKKSMPIYEGERHIKNNRHFIEIHAPNKEMAIKHMNKRYSKKYVFVKTIVKSTNTKNGRYMGSYLFLFKK
jgi:hypothetical protein